MPIAPFAALLTMSLTTSFTSAPAIASAPSTLPPMTISVVAASDIPSSLITAALKEADAIWRAAGIRFTWDRHDGAGPFAARVIIGGGQSNLENGKLALGWIVLDDEYAGMPQIYLSHGNAQALLNESRGVVGHVSQMPIAQREAYMARAMGRALAHEMGHFLSGSKVHAAAGLMMAVHSAAELFGPERRRFEMTPAEEQRMAARFTSIYIASRN